MLKKTIISVLACTAALFLLTGCISMDETICFSSDGSSTLTVEECIEKDVLESSGSSAEEVFSPDENAEEITKTIDGVDYVGYRTETTCNSLAALNDSGEDNTIHYSYTEEGKAVTLVFTPEEYSDSSEDMDSGDYSEEDLADLFKVTLRVDFPGKIVSVDGLAEDAYTLSSENRSIFIDNAGTSTETPITIIGLLLENGGYAIHMKRTYQDQFADVNTSDWFYNSVAAAYESGIVSGQSDTKFNPSAKLSIAGMLSLAAHLRSEYKDTEVPDIDNPKNWYDSAVAYLISEGTIAEGEFSSYTATATRTDIAKIFAKVFDADVYKTADEQIFPDVSPETDGYAAIQALAASGVVSGTGNGSYNPTGTLTRAQAAAFVTNMIALSAK